MKRTLRIVTAFMLCSGILISQMPDDHPYLTYPAPYTPGRMETSIGASLTLLPRSVVEEEIRQLPMITGSVRYGLPYDFSLRGTFSTVYITNVITGSLLWSASIGPVTVGLSDGLSYWFGIADMEGFDTRAMGLVNTPGIHAGIDVDGYLISSTVEMLLLISQHTYFGSASVGRIKPEIAGIVTSLTLEQDLWNSTFLSFTLRGNYARPNYQLWLAFSVQDRWLIYPELQVSFLF